MAHLRRWPSTGSTCGPQIPSKAPSPTARPGRSLRRAPLEPDGACLGLQVGRRRAEDLAQARWPQPVAKDHPGCEVYRRARSCRCLRSCVSWAGGCWSRPVAACPPAAEFSVWRWIVRLDLWKEDVGGGRERDIGTCAQHYVGSDPMKSQHTKAKRALQEIWMAETKTRVDDVGPRARAPPASLGAVSLARPGPALGDANGQSIV